MEINIPNLISYLTSVEFQIILGQLKIIFIVFSLFLLLVIIFFLFKSSYLKFLILQDLVEFFTYRPYGIRRIVRQWEKIIRRLELGSESEYKMAIIEADSLLRDILKRMGYSGETLGELLKNLTKATIPNLDSLLEAHQIRNNIIHDPDYRLTLEEVKRTLAIYEETFRNLEAL